MASNIYGAIALIGGGTGSVDSLDGAALADQDIMIAVVQDDAVYHYVLDATSGASEASPDVISPDTNAGTKRWILIAVYNLIDAAVPPALGGTTPNTAAFTTLDCTAFTSNGIDDNASAEKIDVGDSIVDVLTGANIRAVDGILFGSDTAAVNMLDDYEEGTFTPELWDNSLSGSESQTYSTQVGFYTRIGNRVFFDIRLVLTSLGSLTTTQDARIGGLPFTHVATSLHRGSVTIGFGAGFGAIGAGNNVSGFIDSNASHINLYSWDTTNGESSFSIANYSASGNVTISGCYTV